MKNIKMTITVVLSDKHWGFSEMLNGEKLNNKDKFELYEIVNEDLFGALENAVFDFEYTDEEPSVKE